MKNAQEPRGAEGKTEDYRKEGRECLWRDFRGKIDRLKETKKKARKSKGKEMYGKGLTSLLRTLDGSPSNKASRPGISIKQVNCSVSQDTLPQHTHIDGHYKGATDNFTISLTEAGGGGT